MGIRVVLWGAGGPIMTVRGSHDEDDSIWGLCWGSPLLGNIHESRYIYIHTYIYICMNIYIYTYIYIRSCKISSTHSSAQVPGLHFSGSY